MDILSYRGPGVAGGVSSGLASAWHQNASSSSRWWYVKNRTLEVLAAQDADSRLVALIPETVKQGHYAFCNEFLWPLMHDLPQHISFSQENYEHYKAFNRLLSEYLYLHSRNRNEFFVQDYQMSLLPQWLNIYGHKSVIFWHIPWPKQVADEHKGIINEIVRGLLGAAAIGFHTQEYATNFQNYINDNLSDYQLDSNSFTVEPIPEEARDSGKRRLNRRERGASRLLSGRSHKCKIVVHPLGIEIDYWHKLAEDSLSSPQTNELRSLANKTFILSVDRCDYTKSVKERFLIIDRFFEVHPEWLGSVSFAQVCGRSRPGLEQFDAYWQACRALAGAVNNRWRQDNWQPISWIEGGLNSLELAYLYRHAQAMIVNPVRDGLNLTAKEFVACQDGQPGVLLLSQGAGVHAELGHLALPADPEKQEQTVQSIARALCMPLKERQIRTLRMKSTLANNQLSDWWETFSSLTEIPEIHLVAASNSSFNPAKFS
ncbi:MAG: trehalose-6-phosphate synthase [Candidatus Obscuribacterales bacterium]|nr:trehalose-6-phosphate synthase [Candidatus Obscuribacterales bacterium]